MKPLELVVCSGKGGTGKTSVVASFAALAGKLVLADCDVDAADLHLVLEPDVKRRERFIAGHVAVVDPTLCNGCQVCEDVCRFDAIRLQADGAAAVDPVNCEGCGVCVHFCPRGAIEFPDRDCGEWFVSETRCGPMIHARLGTGAENSGKLVNLVREKARDAAEQRELDLVLVDGPPGIGCPVISAISGADLLLVVAEPTVSGRHDMERLIALAKHFRLPAAVCVNKSDLDRETAEGIAAWCGEQQVPVLGEIPYDIAVTKAQLDGVSVVEHGASPAAEALQNLWRATEKALRETTRRG